MHFILNSLHPINWMMMMMVVVVVVEEAVCLGIRIRVEVLCVENLQR